MAIGDKKRVLMEGTTAAEVGAVSAFGDTIHGVLKIQEATATPLTVQNTQDKYTFIAFAGSQGRQGAIGFDNTDVPAVDVGANVFKLLHTGNKLTGSYTGNGDAAERTVEIGGIGDVLEITSAYSGATVLVSPYGAAAITGINFRGYTHETAYFENGVLTIRTSDLLFNANNQSYRYRVL